MDAEELREGVGIMDHTKTYDNHSKIWCLVTQRDDICYSFKFKEDAKGQEVMDEVNFTCLFFQIFKVQRSKVENLVEACKQGFFLKFSIIISYLGM